VLGRSGTTGTVYIRAIIGEGEGVVSTTDASMNMAVTTQENAASSGSYAWYVGPLARQAGRQAAMVEEGERWHVAGNASWEGGGGQARE
jgi:hypothetical protein